MLSINSLSNFIENFSNKSKKGKDIYEERKKRKE